MLAPEVDRNSPMFELTLPKNFKLTPRLSWPRLASKNVRRFRVYRRPSYYGKKCTLTRAVPKWTIAVSRAPKLAG